MLGGALYDKYYSETKGVEVGYFPWYANPSRGKAHEKFPEGLVFITKDKRYDFDVRSDLNFYYLISDKFNILISKFDVPMVDVAPIEVRSTKGGAVSEGKYHAAVFPSFDPEAVANNTESQFVNGKFGGIARIKKLTVNDNFLCHIFKLKDMEGSSNTLICSEAFRDAAIALGVSGIDFFDAASVDWPTIKPI